MATAEQVLKSSLQRILVQASEAPLEQDEFGDAINDMNNYMFALDAEGVTLGYTEITSLSDEVTIPIGALRGLIANLAIEISPDYGGIISEGLRKAAKQGMIAMENLGVSIGQSFLPATLPVGSGNETEGASRSTHFYPDSEAEILAETTGAIGLETGTEDAA